ADPVRASPTDSRSSLSISSTSAGCACDPANAVETARSSAFSQARNTDDRPDWRPSATSAASIAAGMPTMDAGYRFTCAITADLGRQPRDPSPDLGVPTARRRQLGRRRRRRGIDVDLGPGEKLLALSFEH